LEIVALSRHPDADVSDPGPGIEQSAERVEGAIVGGQTKSDEFRLLPEGAGRVA